MAQIPQIYRDRLPSSVVGTPGIDTSPSAQAEAFSGASGHIAAAAFDFAIAKQQAADTAETNRLLVNSKIATIEGLEKIKQDYAMNPEASGEALKQLLDQSQQNMTAQASNPRVKSALSKGDAWFDGRIAMDHARWQLDQRSKLDKKALFDSANLLANDANKIAGDPNIPYVVKKEQLLTKFSAVGNLAAGAFALAHPDEASKFELNAARSIYKGTIYGMLDANPAQAVTFLQESEVKKLLPPDEITRLESGALARLKGQVTDAAWVNSAKTLLDSPEMVQKVLDGDVTWTQLDQAEQTPLIKELKQMAVQTSPQAAVEQQTALTRFYDEAHDIGYNLRRGEKSPEVSVAQLVKFQTDLAHAYNGGLINRSTYEQFNKKLASPLIAAVMEAHDPSLLEQVKAGLGSWFSQHAKKPSEMTDQYSAGYGVIDKYVKSVTSSPEQTLALKNKFLSKFIDTMDKIDPTARDGNGRPYSPQSVAQGIIGIEKGMMMQTPFGPRSIDAHDEHGQPQHNFTDEEFKMLTHLKELKMSKTWLKTGEK